MFRCQRPRDRDGGAKAQEVHHSGWVWGELECNSKIRGRSPASVSEDMKALSLWFLIFPSLVFSEDSPGVTFNSSVF